MNAAAQDRSIAELSLGDKEGATDTLSQMRRLAHGTQVEIFGETETPPPQFVTQPVFRYSDQPRRIQDATLWAWTVNGRPGMFLKVESVLMPDGTKRPWIFCVSSVSEHLIDAQFPGGHRYQSQKRGVEYRLITDAPLPSANAVQRRRQMKQLALRFSATIIQEPTKPVTEEMRLLPRPVMEYTMEGEDLPTGAVFGLTSGGTNPDAFLIIEATDAGKGSELWKYVAARMTTGGVELRLDEVPVWTVPWVPPHPKPFDRWTFFRIARDHAALSEKASAEE